MASYRQNLQIKSWQQRYKIKSEKIYQAKFYKFNWYGTLVTIVAHYKQYLWYII